MTNTWREEEIWMANEGKSYRNKGLHLTCGAANEISHWHVKHKFASTSSLQLGTSIFHNSHRYTSCAYLRKLTSCASERFLLPLINPLRIRGFPSLTPSLNCSLLHWSAAYTSWVPLQLCERKTMQQGRDHCLPQVSSPLLQNQQCSKTTVESQKNNVNKLSLFSFLCKTSLCWEKHLWNI